MSVGVTLPHLPIIHKLTWSPLLNLFDAIFGVDDVWDVQVATVRDGIVAHYVLVLAVVPFNILVAIRVKASFEAVESLEHFLLGLG